MKTIKARPPTRRKAPTKSPATALEKRVLDVIGRHPGWNQKEIADDLGEDVFEVFDVIQALIEKGTVGEKV
jgi:DNA-binding MarR family transcriptional regulator